MQVGKYTLVNEEKVNRALVGTPGMNSNTKGGIAKSDGSYDEAALLAEYDKFGGLILVGSDAVKMGSFYDFKSRKPFTNPKVVFTYRVNGKVVDVEDGVELPGEVKAVKIEAEEAKVVKKVRKAKE